ncbi:hypothetical protein [Algoriphagus namhaensis]
MEKLTNDQMENLVGGRECFGEALAVEIAGERYRNDPSDLNLAAWALAWSNLINCAQA